MGEVPTKWVQVSTELLAQLGEWSEPVQVKVESDVDSVLEMTFKVDQTARAARAAPDLLAALEALCNARTVPDMYDERWAQANAAIDKARGSETAAP